MAPPFLDTSFVIALFNLDDPSHAIAEAWHAHLRRVRSPLVTTTAILAEIGDGFARKGRWDLAEPFLLAVFDDPTIEVVTVDVVLALRAVQLRRRRADKRWGLTDCISFVVMDDRGMRDALTADQDFVQAGFRALLREPPDINIETQRR